MNFRSSYLPPDHQISTLPLSRVLSLAVTLTLLGSAAATEYDVTVIPVRSTWAAHAWYGNYYYHINNSGMVAGWRSYEAHGWLDFGFINDTHGFMWDGTVHELPELHVGRNMPSAINDSGLIAGNWLPDFGPPYSPQSQQAMIWPGGTSAPLQLYEAGLGTTWQELRMRWAYSFGINAAGVVVGQCTVPGGG
jgi:hypothetical protein